MNQPKVFETYPVCSIKVVHFLAQEQRRNVQAGGLGVQSLQRVPDVCPTGSVTLATASRANSPWLPKLFGGNGRDLEKTG